MTTAIRRLGAVIGVLFALFLIGIAGAASASAEPPANLTDQITDSAGVLSSGDVSEITDAINKLYADEQIQLWVTYVDTFDNQNSTTWATDTAQLSSLGPNSILLAVAVQAGAYGYDVPSSFPLSQSQVSDIMVEQVQPELSNGDWAGAAVTLADGLGGGRWQRWQRHVVAGRRRRRRRRRWLPVVPVAAQGSHGGRCRPGRYPAADRS